MLLKVQTTQSHSAAQAPFEKLPENVMRSIVQEVGPKDMGSLCQTSTTIRNKLLSGLLTVKDYLEKILDDVKKPASECELNQTFFIGMKTALANNSLPVDENLPGFRNGLAEWAAFPNQVEVNAMDRIIDNKLRRISDWPKPVHTIAVQALVPHILSHTDRIPYAVSHIDKLLSGLMSKLRPKDREISLGELLGAALHTGQMLPQIMAHPQFDPNSPIRILVNLRANIATFFEQNDNSTDSAIKSIELQGLATLTTSMPSRVQQEFVTGVLNRVEALNTMQDKCDVLRLLDRQINKIENDEVGAPCRTLFEEVAARVGYVSPTPVAGANAV